MLTMGRGLRTFSLVLRLAGGSRRCPHALRHLQASEPQRSEFAVRFEQRISEGEKLLCR